MSHNVTMTLKLCLAKSFKIQSDSFVSEFYIELYSHAEFYLSPPQTLSLPLLTREQPIYTTRAHVFQIDPTTKKNWVPASKQAVTVSYFYDSTRNSYRIISVDGSKVGVFVCVTFSVCVLQFQEEMVTNILTAS